MSFFDNKERKCDGCICHVLEDPEIFIDDNKFHNLICCLHYKYIKTNPNEKELYEKTGKNYFIDVVEYNIIKNKIRDVTLHFLAKYIEKFFSNN